MIWEYQNILGPQNHTREIDKIHKDWELYQVFMHKFLFQNVQVLPLHILITRRISTFKSQGIDKFWSGGIKTY